MKKIIKVVTMILISLSAVAAFPDATFSKDKPYVSKKLHYAYITGYSDGSFRPYEFITRQEAAVIVCRLTDIASANVKSLKMSVLITGHMMRLSDFITWE